MRYDLKEKENAQLGDLVKRNGELFMICKEVGEQYSLKLLDLQSGVIVDYGFYGDINKFCKEYNLKLVCKNECLIISN